MSGGLTTRIIISLAELQLIAADWRSLWKNCPAATPFQRCEWLLPWVEIFVPDKLRVVEIRHAGQLVGLAPLLIYSRNSSRVLALAGGGVSDYLDALIHPAFLEQAVAATFVAIGEFRDQWDVVELTDLPCSSPLLQVEHTVIKEPHDACPVLHIPAAALQLSDFIPARQLRNLRNARTRASKLKGLSVEMASISTGDSFLEVLFRLHSARWNSAGMPGVLYGAKLRAFHSRVLRNLLPNDIVRLYGLRLGDRFIAALYAMFERDTAYYYLQGFDPEFAWYSPGTQLIAAVVEDARKEGKQQVDFLRGRENYKYLWGARDSLTTRITCLGVQEMMLAK